MVDTTSSSEVVSGTSSNPNVDNQISQSNSPIQITNIRLNGDNFVRWSQAVRMYIRGRGKIGYLTGETPAPNAKDPKYATWDAENNMIMTWLVSSMDDDIGSNYLCYPTGKDLWDYVCQMYSDLGNQSQVYELQLKLSEIKQGTDSVTKYFNILKRLWQDLDMYNAYEWKSFEDYEHYKKMVECNWVYKFLAGLNVEFDEIRGRIIGRVPLPSLGEIFSEVRREESRRSMMLGAKGPSGIVEVSTLVTAGANVGKLVSN